MKENNIEWTNTNQIAFTPRVDLAKVGTLKVDIYLSLIHISMNVYPCASSSTSTRYTPMRKTVVSLRGKDVYKRQGDGGILCAVCQ